MMTDFRALCAELADAYLRTLEHINNSTWLGYEPSDDPLLQRARAALGEADEPAVPQSREPAAVTGQPRPTEDDVEDAAQCIYEAMRFERVETTPAWSELGNSLAQDTARKAARAVLAHWGNHVPTPPADGEVAELVADLQQQANHGFSEFISRNDLLRAAELLQRQVPWPFTTSSCSPSPTA